MIEWGEWVPGPCSTSCGVGTITDTRQCINSQVPRSLWSQTKIEKKPNKYCRTSAELFFAFLYRARSPMTATARATPPERKRNVEVRIYGKRKGRPP